MRALVLCVALLATTSCESAARHPAITIGAVTGTMGFGLCALSVNDTGTCAIIGGGAALALGGITALVTLLANTNAPDDAVADPGLDPRNGPVELVTEPPPGLPPGMTPPLVDAGVPAPDAM